MPDTTLFLEAALSFASAEAPEFDLPDLTEPERDLDRDFLEDTLLSDSDGDLLRDFDLDLERDLDVSRSGDSGELTDPARELCFLEPRKKKLLWSSQNQIIHTCN